MEHIIAPFFREKLLEHNGRIFYMKNSKNLVDCSKCITKKIKDDIGCDNIRITLEKNQTIDYSTMSSKCKFLRRYELVEVTDKLELIKAKTSDNRYKLKISSILYEKILTDEIINLKLGEAKWKK